MAMRLFVSAAILLGFTSALVAADGKPSLSYELPRDDRPADVRIREATEEIRTAIERLRKSGRDEDADRYAARLKDVRLLMSGAYDEPKLEDPDPEMHVVGIYEGEVPPEVERTVKHPLGFAAVKVTYTHRPIVLVLSSYEPVAWNVNLAEGVKVERVVLCGYYGQDITGLPEGVPVEGKGDSGVGHRPTAYKVEELSGRFGDFLRKNYALEPVTFQGTYRYAGTPFVVGPENPVWRAAKVWQRLEPLYLEATKEVRVEFAAELTTWTFTAMHVPVSDDRFGRADNSIATFTPLGPIKSTMKPVEDRCRHVAYDPDTKQYYALKAWPDHSLVTLDAETGKMTGLDVPGLSELGHVSYLALDTKRKRLLIGSHALQLYNIETGKVTDIGERGHDLVGLTYATDEDVYYAAYAPYSGDSEGRKISVIAKWNVEGAVMEKTTLQRPIQAGEMLAESRIFARDSKLVIMPCANHTSSTSADVRAPAASYVVDTKTGKQIFATLLQVIDN